MTAPTIHLDGVSVQLGARFVLDIPSLTLGPGITVVHGANGSGKSTLLRLLATVTPPARGRLTVAGRSIDDPSTQLTVRRMLGYLPQGDTVAPRVRVFDHVDVVAVMRELAPTARERRAMVYRAIAGVGLTDLASERCGNLSGGQRRRVALAAALAGSSALLVLDEPDTSLDDAQSGSLAAELTERSRTTTIVVATHHASWAAELHPRQIVHLEQGRIVSAG